MFGNNHNEHNDHQNLEPMESFENLPEAESPGPTEGFSNLNGLKGFNCELMLKAIFFGAIFYLLSLPDVYKITKKCCKSVDGVLLHSIVFAVVYYIVVQFI
jgi:hypothetical protein